jgi:hypothetical protein
MCYAMTLELHMYSAMCNAFEWISGDGGCFLLQGVVPSAESA